MNEDNHMSIEELVIFTELSHGSIYRILTENLKLRSVSSKWVPHNLSQENRVMLHNILQFCQRHRRRILCC